MSKTLVLASSFHLKSRQKLSPGINDPGSAISVDALQTKGIFEDFSDQSPDGSSQIVVVLRSQKVLSSLKDLSSELYKEDCKIRLIGA